MPSPVAHSLAALALAEAVRRRPLRRSWGLVLAFAGAAVAADLDFLPGLIAGNADRFHHGPTHSLGAAIMFGVLVWGVLRWRRLANAGWWAGWMTAAYATHVVLDTACHDTRDPAGVPLAWPWSGHYVATPFELFMDIRRDRDTWRFWGSLFQWHNLRAVGWEAALMSLVFGLVWLGRRGAGSLSAVWRRT